MDYVLVSLFGVAIGSFVNVLIYRIPRGLQFITGRSQCPHCSAGIAWYDLIPLASYIALKGSCRHCGALISPIYPIIEFLSGAGALWLFYALRAESPAVFVVSFVFFEIFLALAVIDYQFMILPDGLLLVGLVMVLLLGI